jgi:hypothetical protein
MEFGYFWSFWEGQECGLRRECSRYLGSGVRVMAHALNSSRCLGRRRVGRSARARTCETSNKVVLNQERLF